VTSRWADSPRTSVTRYVVLVGEDALVEALIALLKGGELTAELGEVLAGPASRTVLAGRQGGPSGYWVRVWALRGLLYVVSARATAHVVAACADPAWRVREMALKVIAAHRLDDGLEAAAISQGDDVARVRAAASRALVRLVSAGTTPR
jgi:HEAT repeat protein